MHLLTWIKFTEH